MSSKADLEKIWDRIQDGFSTAEQILSCGECGAPIFQLTVADVQAHMQTLVDQGRAEWHDQGKAHLHKGSPTTKLCVPKGTPQGY